jgi:NTE family protein
LSTVAVSATAVGASMCLPGIVPPVPLGQRLLVDGGVLDNLPVTAMLEEAEGPIIASDVTEPEQRTLAPGESPPDIGLIDTLARVMLVGTIDTEALGRRQATMYIKPDNAFVGRLECHMLDQMRDAGRRAAISAWRPPRPSCSGDRRRTPYAAALTPRQRCRLP